jgi:hypothetical protein
MSNGGRRNSFELRMVRLQPWQLWLLMAIGAGVALALTVAVAGLFLILVPVVLVGGFVAKLVLGSAVKPATNTPRERPRVIEGQYQVVEVERRPR